MTESAAMTESKDGLMFEALAYEAPFLIEKLVKNQIVETAEEAQALFTEVKRYIVLSRSDESMRFSMYSKRVDEAWHQFVLYTNEYVKFSKKFFGAYIHHSPSNAPKHHPDDAAEPAIDGAEEKEAFSFEGFRKRYEELFGLPVPDVWYDEKSINPRRRILNEYAGRLALRGGGGTIDLVDASGDVLLSVNEFAREAIAFVAGTGAFYVRELPGGLTDEEKVALITTLVEYKLLSVAP